MIDLGQIQRVDYGLLNQLTTAAGQLVRYLKAVIVSQLRHPPGREVCAPSLVVVLAGQRVRAHHPS